MIPRYGAPPAHGTAHRLRPGAYAILTGPRGLLLTVQHTGGLRDVQLPGGGIDPGEAPLRALAREVLEETGHRCRIHARLGAYRRFVWMPEYGFHAEKLCHVYLGRAGPRLAPPTEPGHTASWVSPHEAPRLLASRADAGFVSRWLGHGGVEARRPVATSRNRRPEPS